MALRTVWSKKGCTPTRNSRMKWSFFFGGVGESLKVKEGANCGWRKEKSKDQCTTWSTKTSAFGACIQESHLLVENLEQLILDAEVVHIDGSLHLQLHFMLFLGFFHLCEVGGLWAGLTASVIRSLTKKLSGYSTAYRDQCEWNGNEISLWRILYVYADSQAK